MTTDATPIKPAEVKIGDRIRITDKFGDRHEFVVKELISPYRAADPRGAKNQAGWVIALDGEFVDKLELIQTLPTEPGLYIAKGHRDLTKRKNQADQMIFALGGSSHGWREVTASYKPISHMELLHRSRQFNGLLPLDVVTP